MAGERADQEAGRPSTDLAADRDPPPLLRATPNAPGWDRRSLLVLLAGGLLTGSGVAGVLSLAADPGGFELDQLPSVDLEAARSSLTPANAAALVDEAKACRTPLAILTLRPRGASVSNIRVHSGAYTSPSLRVGPDPLRIAVPFPAPYPTGRGEFLFDATGAAFDVFLKPGWGTPGLNGIARVSVWWRVKSAC